MGGEICLFTPKVCPTNNCILCRIHSLFDVRLCEHEPNHQRNDTSFTTSSPPCLYHKADYTLILSKVSKLEREILVHNSKKSYFTNIFIYVYFYTYLCWRWDAHRWKYHGQSCRPRTSIPPSPTAGACWCSRRRRRFPSPPNLSSLILPSDRIVPRPVRPRWFCTDPCRSIYCLTKRCRANTWTKPPVFPTPGRRCLLPLTMWQKKGQAFEDFNSLQFAETYQKELTIKKTKEDENGIHPERWSVGSHASGLFRLVPPGFVY